MLRLLHAVIGRGGTELSQVFYLLSASMLLMMMILMMATVMNCDFSFTAHTLFCNTVDPLIMKREGILVNAGID